MSANNALIEGGGKKSNQTSELKKPIYCSKHILKKKVKSLVNKTINHFKVIIIQKKLLNTIWKEGLRRISMFFSSYSFFKINKTCCVVKVFIFFDFSINFSQFLQLDIKTAFEVLFSDFKGVLIFATFLHNRFLCSDDV
jgi:hypothetical protein